MNLTINITEVSDALVLQQSPLVSAIFTHALEFIENGGNIILQREYENTPPDIIYAFSTAEEIMQWKNRLNDVQAILKRMPIK